jgi:O-antigen ligase
MSVIAGILIYTPSGKRKVILFCLLCFLSVPFLFTYSRGGYLALIVSYLALTAISTRYKPMLLGLFITGIILAPFVLHHSVFDRIAGTFDTSDGVSIGGIKLARSPAARFTVWRDIWDKFLQRPLFGYGVTGIGFFDSQYALELGELGLFGLAVHFWIRWRIWVIALRTFHETSDHLVKGLSLGFMAGFLGLLAHSLSANIFIIVRIMEPFWFLAAMLTVVYQLDSDRSSKEGTESLASGKTNLGVP